MLASAVMCCFPLRVNDWTLSDLDDAVAREKSDPTCCLNQVNMCPLVAMIVNVVADFAEQDSFGLQHSMRLPQEWRIGVHETVPVLLCRSKHQAKTDIEVLRLVSPLIWNMRWIIYHYVEDVILKRHAGVVTNEAGMMLRF